MLKIERYDDYPEIKKQAGNFLDRIYFAVKEYRKCYGESRTPVIFMSQDVLSVLCKGLPDVERHCARSRRIEVAGHEVKLTPGTNILFIGFEI